MHAGLYSSTLIVTDEAKVAGLLGVSCFIDCQLNSQVTSLWLDTGTQVSTIDVEDFKNYHSDRVVRSSEELLDNCDSFPVQWENTADITFTGWVDVIVNIGEENNCESVHVLFLVTTKKLQLPILGFNAIKIIMDAQKNTDALVTMFSMLLRFSNTDNNKKFIWYKNYLMTNKH